jgi:hypothetical protein
MWDYQWVQHPVPLTDSLRSTIYDLSQGVTDFLTKLMILGQRYAIQSGVERLDEQVFLHVAATKMKLLQPALAALRSRDPKEMEKFEDLLPVDAQLAQMMLGDVQVTTDRISLLRGKYEKLVSTMANGERSPTKEPPAPANPNIQLAGLDLTVIPNVEDHTLALSRPPRVAPLSARLESTARVTEVLREVGWVANDPFEFEPAYQIA